MNNVTNNLMDKFLDSHMILYNERELDIYMRGANCRVYNIDGNISMLSQTLIWGDKDGKYVKPKEVGYKKKWWCCKYII